MKLQPLPSPCLKKQFYNVGRHFYICLTRATLTRTNNVRAGWWGVRLQGGGAAGERPGAGGGAGIHRGGRIS